MAQRVLIVDPEPFFTEALASALASDPRVQVVGWTSDEREADELIAAESPDVVLAGIDGGTADVGRWAKRVRGRARVIILTRSPVGDSLLYTARVGASGILGHELGIDELIQLLADADEGRFVTDPKRLGESLQRAAMAPSPANVRADGLERLTDRERQVLDLLASGLDNAGIAKRLRLSSHTVRTHVGNILRKLDVHSRAQAARLALNDDDPGRAIGVTHIRGPDLSPP